MTQASLSPDLTGALGAPSTVLASERRGSASEPALWMVAITSSALVVASVLLLALISQNVIADASLGGFVSGIGVVIAAVGVGGVGYALLAARRAGYLDFAPPSAVSGSVAPAGMHVVPAVPADLGRRKRQQLEAERAARNRQARAIAAAAATTASDRPASAPQRQVPGSTTPPPTTPRPPQTVATHVTPVRAAQPMDARPAPVGSVHPVPAPSARVRPVPARARPVTPPARGRAPVRPAITMPRPPMPQPRPAAWPTHAPVVRMTQPPMRPRTQVALFQVNAANVRAATPGRHH